MKLSFSTNGWKLSFERLIELCNENKIQGLEIHNVQEVSSKDENPFATENISATRKLLFENNVKIACLDSISNLADLEKIEENKNEIKSLIALAKLLDCPFIRIHATKNNGYTTEQVTKALTDNMAELISLAKENDVVLLVESMGIYSNTKDLAILLDSFADDNFSALWDIHHTFRYAGESDESSVKNLGKHIKHLHIKDSKIENDDMKYCLLGEGELPLKDIFDSLRAINYEGYMSLELMPEWIESLGDTEIVLPQFASYMSTFESVPSWQNNLYDNKRKTGKYIWKKETLIERTFSQMLDKVVEEFPDQIAFKFTTLDYTRTYREFRDLSLIHI